MTSKEDTWEALRTEVIELDNRNCFNCRYATVYHNKSGFTEYDETNGYHHMDNPPPICVECRVDHDGGLNWAVDKNSKWKQKYGM